MRYRIPLLLSLAVMAGCSTVGGNTYRYEGGDVVAADRSGAADVADPAWGWNGYGYGWGAWPGYGWGWNAGYGYGFGHGGYWGAFGPWGYGYPFGFGWPIYVWPEIDYGRDLRIAEAQVRRLNLAQRPPMAVQRRGLPGSSRFDVGNRSDPGPNVRNPSALQSTRSGAPSLRPAPAPRATAPMRSSPPPVPQKQ